MRKSIKVGVGLPAGIPGASGADVLSWAERADAGPFSSLGVIDRLAYDAYDPLIALAGAAAVTHRVRLATNVIAGPLRNTALLAKAAASLDALSGGRLVLGVALGARREDYEIAGVDFRSRGRRLSAQLTELRYYWEETTTGPRPAQAGGPRLLLGGMSDETFGRVARYADGYMHGGGPPRAFARAAEKARAAWQHAGRAGRPELWGQGYFALGGDEAAEAGAAYMRDYYAFTGTFAEKIVAGLLTTPQAVIQLLEGYETAGCDEVMLFPAVYDPAQLERLAEVIA